MDPNLDSGPSIMSGHPWRFRTLVGLERASLIFNLANRGPFGKEQNVEPLEDQTRLDQIRIASRPAIA
jgi:hypothetical protein